jgi:serine phosphatase RsbU (regulator of sigma subunit)/anti-sigma regulatory factor (Ser/Thr protein kinase)
MRLNSGELGKKQMVRSLDPSAERLERVLDVLLQADRALTNSQEVGGALSQIAEAVVYNFSESCEIDVDGHPGGPDRVRATAGEVAVVAAPGGEIAEALTDGGKRYGTITCRASKSGFDDATRKAIKVLAAELGIVLASQATIRREHRIADRLQRALLPGQLPVVPGVEFHAAYLPPGDEAEIGGDWFDAFDLPNGRIGISIGGVAGRGLEAAVIMGEVRQAIRAAAVGADCAATVLEHVNQIIALREPMDMATAIFGIYDPESSTLSYVSAGHPPPLIALANGLVRGLPSGSLPLGCADTLEARDWTFTIPADAQVIFYTDGLVENERDLVAGEKRLAEAVHDLMLRRQELGTPLKNQATALQERIFNGHSNRDEASVLILSRTAPVESYLFSAVPVVATIARAIVGDELAALGIEHDRRFGILVALGEAIANAIEHAYHGAAPGLIRLKVEHDGRHVALVVEDFGCWKPFVRGEDRGRGIEIMHAIMDGVQICSTRESTQVVLKAVMEPR